MRSEAIALVAMSSLSFSQLARFAPLGPHASHQSHVLIIGQRPILDELLIKILNKVHVAVGLKTKVLRVELVIFVRVADHPGGESASERRSLRVRGSDCRNLDVIREGALVIVDVKRASHHIAVLVKAVYVFVDLVLCVCCC